MSDYTLADTLHFAFTTRSFTTGAPTVLAGTPVVSAYENADLTQITAGITLGVDHDGVVGLNMLTIVASGANGFEAGKDYNLVITTGTVGGVSVVGETVGRFTLSRSAARTVLGAAGAGLTALGDARIANLDATVSSRMATYAQPTGFLAAAFPIDPADQSLVIAATDAIMSRIGAPAGASASADIAAVKADTAAILVDTGTTLDARIPAELVGGRMAANAEVVGDKTGYALSAAGITAIWAEVMEGAISAVQMMRGFASALMGKASGLATTSATYRDTGDTKNRIVASVDADGNRSVVTRDLT